MLNILIISCVIIITLLILYPIIEWRILLNSTPLEKEYYHLNMKKYKLEQKHMVLSAKNQKYVLSVPLFEKMNSLRSEMIKIEHQMIDIQTKIKDGDLN